MFLSILQLISALSITINNSSSVGSVSYTNNTSYLPNVYQTQNIDDSYKVLSYNFEFNLFNDDYIDNEFRKGLNLFDNDYFLISKDITTSGNSQTQFALYLLSTDTTSVNPYVARFLEGDVYPGNAYTQTISQSGYYYVAYGYRGNMQDNFVFTHRSIYLTAGSYTFNPTFTLFEPNHIIIDNIMFNKGVNQYSYQPYYSDSELLDVDYTYNIFSYNLTDGSSTYFDFLGCNITFSFAQRVDNSGQVWLDKLIFYCYHKDYNNVYGQYPILNFNWYTTFAYLGSDMSFQYNGESSLPLIFATEDSYSNYFNIPIDERSYVDDLIRVSFNFQFLSSDLYNAFINGINRDAQYENGYNAGYYDGYIEGEGTGYSDGYSDGITDGRIEGYQSGVNDGRSEVIEQGQTASIIFNGIISVGLLPTNVFLRILNFEVFGINIGALVSSLLTILVIIIIVRTFLGGNSKSE